MKWYITEPTPIAENINTVKIVQKEMGSEAAVVVLKWPYRPVVTKAVMVEQPIMDSVLDGEGNPVLDEFGEPTYQQNGTQMVETQQAVSYPYIVDDAGALRAATDEEAAAIDAVLEQRAADAALAAEAQAKLDYAAALSIVNPILEGHPAAEDVPEGGQQYRIPDAEDPSILTWWCVRDSDLVAQQISAHDAAGRSIHRSVNLVTREQTTFVMDEIVAGLKNAAAQAKAKVSKNVGAAKPKTGK